MRLAGVIHITKKEIAMGFKKTGENKKKSYEVIEEVASVGAFDGEEIVKLAEVLSEIAEGGEN